ncbi:MAG: M15 family peptidase [Thermodesulfobacteriota bacterium]|nr:M15 family peptidase [Thermodesulfobacteriota bacterium]
MSELTRKQKRFPLMVSKLIQFAYENGYEIVFSYAFRCADCPVGKKNSLHKKCLAIDLELFKDGVYLQKTEGHRPLGEYWESLDPENTWGGRFEDGNHYSISYKGMK